MYNHVYLTLFFEKRGNIRYQYNYNDYINVQIINSISNTIILRNGIILRSVYIYTVNNLTIVFFSNIL